MLYEIGKWSFAHSMESFNLIIYLKKLFVRFYNIILWVKYLEHTENYKASNNL